MPSPVPRLGIDEKREDHGRPERRRAARARSARERRHAADDRFARNRRAVREPGANPGRSRRCEGSRSSRRNATGLRAGKAAREGAPSQKTCRSPPTRTPRGRRIRVSTSHRILARRRSWRRSLLVPRGSGRCACTCASKARRTTIFGSTEPTLDVTAERARRARRGQPRRRVLLPRPHTSFGPYVDQIGRYPAAGSSGWVFKVNGVSPPVGADAVAAEGRRHGALVLGDLRRRGRAADARRCERTTKRELLLACCPGRQRHATAARRRAASRRRPQRADPRGQCAASGQHTGLVRATLAGAVRSNALQVKRGLAPRRLLAARPRSPAVGSRVAHGRRRQRDALGRRATAARRVLLVATVPARADAHAGARPRGRREDARTAAASSSRSTASTSTANQRDWFYFVNGYRRRPQRRRVPAARRRRRVVGLSAPGATRCDEPVVVGAFPEPFLHGYGGQVPRRWSSARARARKAVARRVGRRPASCPDAPSRDAERPRVRSAQSRGPRVLRPRCAMPAPAPRCASSSRGIAAGWRRQPRIAPLQVRGAVSPVPQPRCSPRSLRPRCSPTARLGRRGDRAVLLCSSACRRRAAGGGSTSSARSARGSPSSCSGRCLARSARTCSGPGRRARARRARRHARGAAPRPVPGLRLPRSGSRSPPTRCCSTTTGSCRRRGSRGGRCSASRWRRGSCRRSSATPPGSSRRCAGAGWRSTGARGRARLLSPLLAGSLERALNLAEAMEARGFGRPGADAARRSRRWSALDRLALVARRGRSWSWGRCGSSARSST